MEDGIKIDVDLGSDHKLAFTSWHPNRELNPQYADYPDVERCGALVYHLTPSGEECCSGIMFDGDLARKVFSEKSAWRVESMEPLTLSPSLLCGRCGDHGWIREGKWVKA